MGLDVSVDELACCWIKCDGAGAEDLAGSDDGLRVDAWEGLGGLVGEDGCLGHFCFVVKMRSWFSAMILEGFGALVVPIVLTLIGPINQVGALRGMSGGDNSPAFTVPNLARGSGELSAGSLATRGPRWDPTTEG